MFSKKIGKIGNYMHVWCLVKSWELVVTVERKDGNELVKPTAKAGCRINFTFSHIQLLPCIYVEV
jgi:hypothetical protein